jgi:spore coat protein U-like protein
MKQGIVKVLVTCLSLTGLVNIAHAGTSTANPKATAILAAECTISAQNLAFGNLVLPVSAQGASTSMTVLCSKNAAYTVGLAYGGIYGQGGQSTTETATQIVDYAGTYYEVNTTTGVVNPTPVPASSNSGYKTSGAENCQILGSIDQMSPSQLCIYWTNNPTPLTFSGGASTAYAYGEMIGVAKGDHVAYSIQIPGTPGKVWNAGENNYTSTGTGVSQTIPVVGTLVPAQSSGSYPTPDSYIDTVTATVNF